jgi:hypothetical protein
MAQELRRLGTYGENLPVKRSRQVRQAEFNKAGYMGFLERRYNKAMLCRRYSEFQEIFGKQIDESAFCPDVVKGFFDNLKNVPGEVYIAGYLGNDGAGNIDAVVATREVANDGADADALILSGAYKGEPEYGASGNRTGTLITAADRFSTQASATCAATGQSYAELDSVIGFRVGDIVKFVATGGTPGTEYKKITAIDENLKRISWSGNFSASAAALAVNDVVSIPGFTIQTYRKDITGVEQEVDIDRGKIVCTTESEVTEFYVGNIFNDSPWLSAVYSSSDTLADRLISSDSAVTYPTNGAYGTAGYTAGHWDVTLHLFDDLPVRMLANPETIVDVVQTAGEAYCASREDDNPVWFRTIQSERSKSQLITIGNNLQRSDAVYGKIMAHWLGVTDPFSSAVNAPDREIPNVGHVMGQWVRVIAKYGIHHSQAIQQEPLVGANSVIGIQFPDNFDRTDLANAGINCIQEISGVGIVVRNAFTYSTDEAYRFSEGIIMRNFFKVSFIDSLRDEENMPTTYARLQNNKSAILQFFHKMWNEGTTGSVPVGETFGQTFDPDTGVESKPDDHFECKADLTNNTQTGLNAGQTNFDCYFTFPAPNGSIKIGLGILRL